VSVLHDKNEAGCCVGLYNSRLKGPLVYRKTVIIGMKTIPAPLQCGHQEDNFLVPPHSLHSSKPGRVINPIVQCWLVEKTFPSPPHTIHLRGRGRGINAKTNAKIKTAKARFFRFVVCGEEGLLSIGIRGVRENVRRTTKRDNDKPFQDSRSNGRNEERASASVASTRYPHKNRYHTTRSDTPYCYGTQRTYCGSTILLSYNLVRISVEDNDFSSTS